MKKILFLMLLNLAAQQAHAKDLKCERFIDESCMMDIETSIESTGIILPSTMNKTVKKLVFSKNKKIHFLLEKVAKNFPFLHEIWADGCSLTEVYKINFLNMDRLGRVILDDNQITRIASNTFDDSPTLDWVSLGKKYLNLIHECFVQKISFHIQ